MKRKGHWGEYTGNAKWSKDHAHTRVTKGNYKATERDDAAHIDYLKRDVLYDAYHGHNDKKMTADEKHISKLAGDMKYDKKHHSPFHAHDKLGAELKDLEARQKELVEEFGVGSDPVLEQESRIMDKKRDIEAAKKEHEK